MENIMYGAEKSKTVTEQYENKLLLEKTASTKSFSESLFNDSCITLLSSMCSEKSVNLELNSPPLESLNHNDAEESKEANSKKATTVLNIQNCTEPSADDKLLVSPTSCADDVLLKHCQGNREATTLSTQESLSPITSKHITTQDFENTTTFSACQRLNSSTFHSKKKLKKFTRRFNVIYQPSYSWIKRHLYWVIAFIILFLLLIGAIVCVYLFWIIPSIMQSTLNKSVLELNHLMLMAPTKNSTDVKFKAFVTRPRAETVELKPFEIKVSYRALSNSLAFEPSTLNLKKRLLSVQAVQNHNESILNEKVLKPSPYKFPKYRNLFIGILSMPSMIFQGKTTQTEHESTFFVKKLDNFDILLKDLVTTDEAECLIEADLTVKFLGLEYSNIKLSKILPVKGIQLFKNSADAHEVKPNNLQDATDQANNVIHVKKIDITVQNNYKQQDLPVPIKVELEFTVPKTQIINIESIGLANLGQSYNNIPILDLTTVTPITFVSGTNSIKLEGSLPRLNDMSLERRTAFISLIETILSGERVMLETQGKSCSTRLYNSAIEGINFLFPLRLFSEEVNQKKQYLIKGADIKNLEIIPSTSDTLLASDKKYLALQGSLRLLVLNPFGEENEASLDISRININTTLSVVSRKTKKEAFAAHVEGVLLGLQPSYSVKQNSLEESIGLQSVLHVIDVTFSIELSVFEVEESKIESKKYYELSLSHNSLLNEDTNNQDTDADQPELMNTKKLGIIVLLQEFLSEPTVLIRLYGTQMSVHIKSFPLGDNIELNNLNLPFQEFELQGFDNFQNLQITRFHIGDFGVGTTPDEDGFLEIAATVLIPSKYVTINLGNITLELTYREQHVAFLKATNCLLTPGDNIIRFSGHIKSINSNTLALVRLVLTGNNPSVDITLTEISSKVLPNWLKSAVINTTSSISLDGLHLS